MLTPDCSSREGKILGSVQIFALSLGDTWWPFVLWQYHVK